MCRSGARRRVPIADATHCGVSGLSERLGITRFDFSHNAFWGAVAQDHALESLSGDLIESRLNYGVSDHTSALLHELFPALLIGGIGRREIRIVVGACPGDHLAAARSNYLSGRACHILDEFPSSVL